MSAGDQINRVRKYIGQLKDEAKIHHALSRLDRIDMTVDLLTETHVGKEVNRLRNHDQYGAKAKKIVDKWRLLASPEAAQPPPPAAVKRPMGEVEEISSESRMSFADALKAAAPVVPPVKKIKITYAAPPSESPSASGSSSLPPSLCGQGGGSNSSVNVPKESDDMFTILRKGKPMKVYAGRKQTKVVTKLESLYNLAMTVCMQNVNLFTHGPLNTVYAVFKPVLQRCTPEQLQRIEYWNPSFEEDTDELWEVICKRAFPRAKPDYDETWKECYKRGIKERDDKLAAISNRFKKDHKVDVMSTKKLEDQVIAPRNIQRRQANYGTSVASRQPSAIEISQARREIYRTGNKSAVASLPTPVRLGGNPTSNWPPPPRSGGSGASSSTTSSGTQGRGALMTKTLRMMKNRRR
uniref:TFIIS N-terminal domain-containing protein n=1 Tax=Panagrellus redivivus TaxID=6233 RepID=A0A7E4V3Y6_PANRE